MAMARLPRTEIFSTFILFESLPRENRADCIVPDDTGDNSGSRGNQPVVLGAKQVGSGTDIGERSDATHQHKCNQPA
jgi:hypothetical protein